MPPSTRSTLAALVLCAFLARSAPADTPADLFPFVLPADTVTEGITDLSFLNDKPADELVSVRDGHFYAGGKRIRFWGVCVIGVACFPTHDQAPLVARRLANRGINQVRIHLIDGHYAPQGLFDPASPGQLRILPSQLDRLDFFIAQLKKHGIYVELPVNGYHWRNITAATQYPGLNVRKFDPFCSGIPLWNPAFVAGEKRLAREFFGHVNPYTGKAYTEEPAVSTMEIVNENGLICAWRGGHFRKAWPESMISDLQRHWNLFLKTRYTTTDRLRQAWATGEIRADPREMLQNGDLARGSGKWWLQVVKPSTAAWQTFADGGPAGRPYGLLASDRAADNNAFVILQHQELAVEKGTRYTLSFQAKADLPADAKLTVNACVSMNHAPWVNVGLANQVEVGPAWREVTLHFVGTRDEPAAKLMIIPPGGPSRLSLSAFSLRKGDVIGLPAGESLEAANISMPPTPEDNCRRTGRFAADFVDFLYELDGRYFDSMRDFLKNELGCRHPIKGTQVDQYSSYFSQARYDYTDSHGYWEHPHFPRAPWSPTDWTVANSPMVNRGGRVVVELATQRVRGMPYNISEYCHPAPSTYCAEQVPTIAAFGAVQDWDGVVFHCWQELVYDWKVRRAILVAPERIDSWFNMARHPVKLVTMPFGALAFRRGDVAAARGETVVGITLGEEKRWLGELARQAWSGFPAAEIKGVTWRDAFTNRLALALNSAQVPTLIPADRNRTSSDSGQLDYDLTDTSRGVIAVNAPRAKAVIGFGSGKTFALGDVTVKPGPTRQQGFSVITASAVRGESFHAPDAAILVTATGYVENGGMVWNAERTSVGNHWGEGYVMCEGVPFELLLTVPHATAWPLDNHGRRLAPIAGEPTASSVRFRFGPQHKTLWYEIAVVTR